MREFAARSARAIGFVVLAFGVLAGVPRGAAAQDAGAFVAHLGQQGIQVLGPSVPPAQRAAVFRQLFDADFDLPGIAHFVLGPQVRAMSPQAQQEFTPLLRDYLVQAYTTRLGQYAGAPFRVTGVRPMGGETVVTSQIVRRGGQPVELDWHVMNNGGRWLVEDVVVDGISMRMTHRNEFAAVIQRNGGRPEALLAALRQQLASSAPAPLHGAGSSMPGSGAPTR